MDKLAVTAKMIRRIEEMLRTHYHAKGESLAELVASCEERLPHDVHEKLHEIIITAPLAHEANNHSDFQRFIDLCKACETELQPRSTRLIWRVALFLILAVTLSALVFYVEYWSEFMGH